jgi:SAM-dependent methyltransferase
MDDQFYKHTTDVHNLTAPRLVVPLVMQLTHPTSVLDVGCGTGTWLVAFSEQGVSDYLGIDGEYVDQKLLQIPLSKFKPVDLRKDWSLGRRFDLVVSLEVAEHIDERSADLFVAELVKHGDVILFSAAIPGQKGQYHVNEQWPEYWQEKFHQHGYFFQDVIRKEIWNNKEIDFWYRQNIFLIRKGGPGEVPFNALSLVHPELLSRNVQDHAKMLESLISGKQGLRVSAKIFFNAIRFKLRSLF